MHGWVQCVPNLSEGQDENLLAEFERLVRAVPGVAFLGTDRNPDHHRTLFTFAGPGGSVRRAAFDLIRAAMAKIDLNRHIGSHPRMGAVDVVPFVPLGTTTMEAASTLARELGEEVGRKLGLPVFLYGESAARPEMRFLADIRKGGFEGHLAGGYPLSPPDFGPPRPHPTAGSVAIGARQTIIAFNLILDTNDLEAARSVARAVRESSRGLPAVRALGIPLASQGLVQVAINILDHKVTSITRVVERAREEARRFGTSVLESELVGLVPREALADSVWEVLRLPARRRERVIEDAIESCGAFTFAERLAAATPTPGGGAAAARSGLHAASLIRMVTGIAAEKLRKGAGDRLGPVEAIRTEAEALGKRFRALEVEDEEAFDALVSARRKERAAAAKLASGSAEPEVREAALKAAEVPLALMEAAGQALSLIERTIAEHETGVPMNAGSDLGAATELASAAFRTAELNVRVNLPQIGPPRSLEIGTRCDALSADLEPRADALRAEIRRQFLP